jgi:hypothetical protein
VNDLHIYIHMHVRHIVPTGRLLTGNWQLQGAGVRELKLLRRRG